MTASSPRYILIDRDSGYIFADTATMPGFGETAADAAKALDAELKNAPADYSSVPRRSAAAVYDVYRADVNGSEAVPVIHDGQDREMIEAVERDCEYVCALARLAVVDVRDLAAQSGRD